MTDRKRRAQPMPKGRNMADQKAKLFDRFAEASADVVSRAPFFVACVLLVVVWAPTFWLFPSVDTWQLVINTATTIVTFLMVALLQNSQRRAEQAIHQKLDAVADGLADFMEHLGGDQPGFAKDIDDLRRAVGVEKEMVNKHG
jgi:Flp pilus assembly protein TadB